MWGGEPISCCTEARKVGGRDIFYLRLSLCCSTETPDTLSLLEKKARANSAQRMASAGSDVAVCLERHNDGVLVWVQTVPARWQSCWVYERGQHWRRLNLPSDNGRGSTSPLQQLPAIASIFANEVSR